MSQFSNYFEDAIANWFRGTTFPAATGSVYVALFTAAPSDAGGGTEVTGNAYARVAVAKSAGSWNATSGGNGLISNVAAIVFPTATPAGWGTVTHIGIFDASTSGNLIMWGALAASQTINAGDVAQFSAGVLTLTFA